MLNIIHVEDDELDARSMKSLLAATSRSYILDQVPLLQEAVERSHMTQYDAVLLDLSLPDCYGPNALSRIRKYFPNMPVIVVTGNSDLDQAERFVDLGADDYLFKSELTTAAVWKSIIYSIRKKNLERELQAQACDLKIATELEKRANRCKTEFLANVSHDLRTPLGIVLGYAEILEGLANIPQEASDYIQRIKKTSLRLVDLVNDLLDLSKVEAGHLEVNLRDADLGCELAEAWESYAFKANSKDLEFHVHYESQIPKIVRLDTLRTRQILDNIVANAIKFTDSGAITVTIRVMDQDSAFLLTVDVEDTGPGISRDSFESIFEPFNQLNSDISHKYGGTGLGLALAKKLARSLNGNVNLVQSAVGEGSVFRFILPVEVAPGSPMVNGFSNINRNQSQPGQRRSSMVSSSTKKKVLLAEDSVENQLLFETILKASGVDVEVVSNGMEAVERALVQTFDVIFMDMQMPVMDGYDAVRELRKKGYSGPIIALTAFAMSEEKERCLSIGCDEFLSKPVSAAVLVEKVVYAGVSDDKPAELMS